MLFHAVDWNQIKHTQAFFLKKMLKSNTNQFCLYYQKDLLSLSESLVRKTYNEQMKGPLLSY